jgi:hypothetical protein
MTTTEAITNRTPPPRTSPMPSEVANEVRQMKIWQQNCRKSLVNQIHLVNSLNPNLFDLCLIQEPYIDFLNNTRAPSGWRVIYPASRYRDNKHIRSVILVSPRLATSSWMDLHINSLDVTAIQLWGELGSLLIFNVYNDCEHADSLKIIEKWYENPRVVSMPPTSPRPGLNLGASIWAGDFNHHHPLWEEERNKHLFTRHELDKMALLLELLASQNMEMALPKDIPTLQHSSSGNWTRPDNVFISSHVKDKVITCDAEPLHCPPKADHLPIMTKIDIKLYAARKMEKRNWRMVDWEEFRKELA